MNTSKVSMFGKNGDLIYCLPVIRALARQSGKKITLVTSALCHQLVPLLYEQSFLQDVEMYEGPVRIERGSMEPWAVLSPDEGLNLSPQPSMYRVNAPVEWTWAYAEIAGVTELTPRDRIALPTLWNHRQWYWEHDLTRDGKSWFPPRTVVLAPEAESLKTIPLSYWRKLAQRLAKEATVIVIGCFPDDYFEDVPRLRDLRGLTTVSSAARLLAETHLVIAANSLPWHLARHAGTPTFCFQDQYLERCTPVDTPWVQYRIEDYDKMLHDALDILEHPRTTLWKPDELRALQKAA